MTAFKLVCTKGPKKGSEYLLDQDEVVIGRANENTIAIADTSVSRKHVLLRRGATGWMVKDLGSGNGTILNGERILDDSALQNGDVVRIGDTELQLVDLENATRAVQIQPAVVPPPAMRTRKPSSTSIKAVTAAKAQPKFTPRRVLTIGVGLLFVMVLGLVTYRLKLSKDEQMALAQQRNARQSKIAAVFQEGKNLVIQGQWTEAKARFEFVKRQTPDYPAVQDYLDSAQREIPNEKHLQEAKEALDKSHLAEAVQALKSVSPETQMYNQLKSLQQTLEVKVASRLAEARAQFDKRNFAAVVSITDDVLAASPQNRDATALNEQAKQNMNVRVARVRTTAPESAPRPTEAAASRFRGGDLSGALALADACSAEGSSPCSRQASQMREFASLYRRVEDLDAKGLARLLSLDAQITGGQQSKMARIAGTRAGTLFYKAAASAKTAGQWAKAVEYARKALQAQPDSAAAASIIADIRVRAKEAYFYAYGQRTSNPDEALTKFKEVMQMTSPDDEFYQKSSNWVDKLSR